MIRGKTIKRPEPSRIDIPVRANIHNRFNIEVVDVKTGKIKQEAIAYNTICNTLWSRLSAKKSYFGAIHYGSGTGTPSAADTSLFSFIGAGKVSFYPVKDINFDPVMGVFSARNSIQLTAGTAVGKTITEVGIGYSEASNSLCTHAMLKDMNGNPISIEKTDTDVINIYATVYVHFNPYGYDNGYIRVTNCWKLYLVYGLIAFLAGISYEYVFAGANMMYDPTFTTDTGNAWGNAPYGNNYYEAGGSYTFDANTRIMRISVNRLEASAANGGGITRIIVGYPLDSSSRHTLSLDVRPKTHSVKDEPVGTGDGITKDFSLDFPYAKNAKLYVNGVEDTNVSVDYGINNVSNFYKYFEWLDTRATEENMIPFYEKCLVQYSGTRMFYNPMFEIGIATLYVRSGTKVSVSNDLKEWVEIINSTSNGTKTIPEEYQHYKYWKGVSTSTSGGFMCASPYATPGSGFNGNVVHFANAPASGSTIIADYDCDCIPKDANHVFDMSITIQLGEYTEAQ